MKIYSYENPNEDVRRRSSAGGLFSALAEKTLAEDGVVYGASFDNDWRITHRRVDSMCDIDCLRRSKYAFTNIGTCFCSIAKDIKSGRPVLVVGTPCQVAAVRKRFPKNDNLLLVEVVCHGAPQPKYWDLYLDEVLASQYKTRNDIKAISFRDKTEGWKNYSVRIDFRDGSIFRQNHRDNLYILAFIYNYTLRNGCSKCPFKYPHSKADISMGDFWGIESLAPEIDNNYGSTIAIADSPKGENLLNLIAIESSLNITEVTKYNPAISKAPNIPYDIEKFETLVSDYGFHRAASHVLQPILDNRNNSKIEGTKGKRILLFFYRLLGCLKRKLLWKI